MYVTSIAVSKASEVYFPFVLWLKQPAEFPRKTTIRNTARYDSITRRNPLFGQSKNYTHIPFQLYWIDTAETQSSITEHPDDISTSSYMNISGKFTDGDAENLTSERSISGVGLCMRQFGVSIRVWILLFLYMINA